VRWLLALTIACAIHGAALADGAHPWAAGVSAAQQQQALALYDQGNKFFAADRYKEALEQYELALQAWDHPAIRYNAAVCLINLDRPVEAYEHLIAAMRYGAEPIGADHFAQAHTYQKALAGQVAELEVTCREPGAEVRIDGESFVVGPGVAKRRVRAGTHHVVATKPGYEASTQTIEVEAVSVRGDRPNALVIELHPVAAAHRLVRRWESWKPWALVAAGAGLAGVGGGVVWLAYRDKHDYDAWVTSHCNAGNEFCAGTPVPSSSLDRAKIENSIGITAIVLGGGAFVTGAVMAYLNQGHMAVIAPAVDREHAGVVIVGKW
jgi:hypothetical protein